MSEKANGGSAPWLKPEPPDGDRLTSEVEQMRRLSRVAIVGLILATGNPAFSAEQGREYLIAPDRAEDLVGFCRAAAELHSDGSSLMIYRAATCAAYMTGIADAIRLSHWSGQPGTFAEVCVPAEATRGQLVEALLIWASRHRLDSDRPAREAAFLALADTFPCP